MRMKLRSFGRSLLVALLPGCAGIAPESHRYNPLGWPAKGLTGAGFHAADSELPLVQELGRLSFALGELLDSPALLVEAPATLDATRLGDAGEKLLIGAGSTVTAAINLPFGLVASSHVDLARDAEGVNAVLASMDARDDIEAERRFPPGTRVRASGRNLVWEVPGAGPVLQVAEFGPLFFAGNAVFRQNFVAQERSYGFVVDGIDRWDGFSPDQRAITIAHEFWHQYRQMRRAFGAWTIAYWPSYFALFTVHGWLGHPLETGPNGAYNVERALRNAAPIPASDASR